MKKYSGYRITNKIIASVMLFAICGCQSTGFDLLRSLNPVNWFSSDSERHENDNYAPATMGGKSFIEINKKDNIIKLGLNQPENAKDNSYIKVKINGQETAMSKNEPLDSHEGSKINPSEELKEPEHVKIPQSGEIVIEIGLGGSSELAFNDLKLGDYSAFTYVGVICSVIGIIVSVLSFTAFKIIIPKWLGPSIFISGCITAYMSEAIPKYGPWFMGLIVLCGAGYYVHHSALRKDHPAKNKEEPEKTSN